MHYKRKRPRTQSTHGYFSRGLWLKHGPRWFDVVFERRPRRAETRRLEKKVLKGDDPDNIAWPLDSKPRIYYW